MALDARRTTLFWAGLALSLVTIGLVVGNALSPVVRAGPESDHRDWDLLTESFLFVGLALLGFGFVRKPWAARFTMAGWAVFGFYWSLVAWDLFVAEGGDIVNFLFAIVGTVFFTYLAYHQWLDGVRRVDNPTVRFLNISTFIAATSYFVIDKIDPIRRWLIVTVSDHTYWMLDFFGQGPDKGLVYDRNPLGNPSDFATGPDAIARFSYPETLHTCPPAPDSFWDAFLHWNPFDSNAIASCVPGEYGSGSALILHVSIILACTALQSMMLFVGLYMGTRATMRKRLVASAIVAVVVYVLNLLRNTGIVWFYGQGDMSFWMIHDLVGKGGSLVAMILIAFATFRFFPEFLKELIGVLDLPHRDGPVERVLKLGRRRPEPIAESAATAAAPETPSGSDEPRTP